MLLVIFLDEYKKIAKIMKAFASATRLEILYCIQAGINNPGLIANKMGKHRSTIENHIRTLTDANVISKVSTNSDETNISVNYVLRKNANVILATVKHLLHEQ